MTIDQVRDVVRTEPVRRLVEAAPSGEDVRHMIGGGLEALGDGLGSVAEQVDRSAEAIRDRIAWAEQLARPAPVRRTPWPAIALVSVVVGLAIAVLVSRIERARWSALRARAMELVDSARGRTASDVATRPLGSRAFDSGRDAQTSRLDLPDSRNDLHAIEVERDPTRPLTEDVPLGSAAGAHS
jgi:hypothetical protein